MNTVSCQSCGMPMPQEELFGTEMDGTKSAEYCHYCYELGRFRKPEETMDEMVETCVPFLVEQGMPEAEARKLMKEQLPNLKRWTLSR